MVVRLIAFGAAGLIAISMAFGAWRSGLLGQWFGPAPAKTPPIVFDNGSSRDMPPAPASTAASDAPVKTYAPPGLLRKCVRGDRVTYSNLDCPPGFKESTVSSEGVTVVPSK